MIFAPFERMMAGRYLRARKQEGFVSVTAAFSFLGIVLGVATLIIVLSVMNGFRQELLGRILGVNGHLNMYGYTGTLSDYDMLAQDVRRIEGVTEAHPQIERQALVTVNGGATGAMVRGLEPEDFATRETLANSAVLGKTSDFSGEKVAIGTEMAKRLGLTVGDYITLISPKGRAGPFGSIPRSRRYEIGVVFDVGMFEYNNNFIFMPLTSAQTFFDLPGAVTTIEVFTAHPDQIGPVKDRLVRAFEPVARIYDWRDSNNSFFNALQVERNVMFLILTLIILVAAFNIISSMIMLVKEKGRDIAIMRTIGASRASMMKIFIMTGATIGFTGTATGALGGILFAANIESIRQWIQGLTGTELFSAEIYFLSKLPAEIDWMEVVVVVTMAFALSFLATLYPAWRAAQLDPVEALRYE